jgi:hypothetical protein
MTEEWAIKVEDKGKIGHLGRKDDGRILLTFSDRNLAEQEAAFCKAMHPDRTYTVVLRDSIENYDPNSN